MKTLLLVFGLLAMFAFGTAQACPKNASAQCAKHGAKASAEAQVCPITGKVAEGHAGHGAHAGHGHKCDHAGAGACKHAGHHKVLKAGVGGSCSSQHTCVYSLATSFLAGLAVVGGAVLLFQKLRI